MEASLVSSTTFVVQEAAALAGVKLRPPPDGGYGWVVMLASFFCQVLSLGLPFSFGVYYVAFMDHFNTGKSLTAWIGSLNTGLLFGAGPLVSLLVNYFDARKVIIAGGILGAAGLVISSFATDVYFLCVSFGIVTGVAYCMAYVPSVVTVGMYFDKKLGIAMSFAVSGCGVGSLILGPSLQKLIDIYDWRGALLITGGIFLHVCVCGALMIPLNVSSEQRVSVHKLLDVSLLIKPIFIIFILNNIMWNIGSLQFFVQVTDYAKSCRVDKDNAAFLLAVIGVANTLGRLTASISSVFTQKYCNRLYIFIFANIVSGLAVGLFPLSCSYVAMAGLSAGYGLFFGLQVGLLAVITTQMVGIDKLTSAFGYIMFADGAGAMIGPPVAGWLSELTGSFDVPFYFGGCVIVISGLLMVSVPVVQRHTDDFDSRDSIVKQVAYVEDGSTSSKDEVDDTCRSNLLKQGCDGNKCNTL